MPLLVHCPNRCQIRVPANRMGKVIRCVDCQTPIMIPEFESPLLRTGNWVECRAKRAIKKTNKANSKNSGTNEFATQTPELVSAASTAPARPARSAQSVVNTSLPLASSRQTARLLRAKPWRTVEPLTSVDPEDVLTAIDLDETPSPIKASHQPNKCDGHEPNLEPGLEADSSSPRKLPFIGKLLWFVNPFAKSPPRSF